MTLSLMAALVVAMLIAVWAAIALSMQKESKGLALDSAWLQSFSVDRYRPLARVLDEADFEYLASLPGYAPEDGRRLRERRTKAFVAYLHQLKRDFYRLEAFGRAQVAAGIAPPGLAGDLLRQRLAFLRGYGAVRVQLWMFRWGLRKVDAQAILEPVRSLRFAIQAAAA